MLTKKLKVGLYNAGSLGTNHDNIVASVTRSNVDIVLALNETWIRTGDGDRAPVIPGYRLRHIPRPRELRLRGGGVGFYIKKGLNVRTWRHPVVPLHTQVEQMWLTVTINSKKLLIGTGYRPRWVSADLCLDAITDSVSSSPKYDNLVILGDFNINYLNTDDSLTLKLKSFITFRLQQVVNQPTHFTANRQ